MHLHRSNRAEELVSALTQVLGTPLASSPLEPEVIVVQSKGMERWLSMELALRLGVWANARFPFPRAFIDQILFAVVPEASPPGEPSGPGAAADPWSRERLLWAIAALMHEVASEPEFERVARYHRFGDDAARLLELSGKIADVFDQYAVYRPELVLAWETGADEGVAADQLWQPRLWRKLAQSIGSTHTAARARAFFERWSDARDVSLPKRISVFGVSALPPVYMRVLARVAERAELHLFQLAPSREHLSELRSAREIARTDAEGRELLHLEQGNPLLASFGRVARDFQRSLDELERVEGEQDLFCDPGSDSMLHSLQSDLLNLRQRDPRADEPRPLPSPGDASIVVHSCHGPLREVEVIRDQLRMAFEADSTLEPHDVLVMTPDIDQYAPMVEAVFDADVGQPGYIPYRIADRTCRSDNAVVEVFARVSGLVPARLTASAVLELLELEPVRARFGMNPREVALIGRWLREAGVRWGIDATDRAWEGQPPLDENTWQFGLRRIALGYAMPGDGRELFAGVLPYDDVEGTSAESFGRFGELCDALFAVRGRLQAARSVADWCEAFDGLIEATAKLEDDASWQLSELREVLRRIATSALAAAFTQPVPLEPVRRLILSHLEQERTEHDFLSGGVTFCTMLPMRSIPFRVVCLLGMNDGAFPRSRRPPSFDLISTQPRSGDRSTRDEDRYLFLEALLSARERIIITYVGRSNQDGSTSPPSVVVGELLDVLDDAYGVTPAGGGGASPADAGQRCVVQHPLQPWSRRYFDGSDERLASADSAAAFAARALAREQSEPAPFLDAPLELEGGDHTVMLESIARCLGNPARTLLRDRLGLVLEERPEILANREPLELGLLDQHAIGSELLQRAFEGTAPSSAWDVMRARGVLPLGTPGKRAFARLVAAVERVYEAARTWGEGAPLPPVELALDVGGTRVFGTLDGLWPDAQLVRSYARVKARTELACWVRHLALQLVADPALPRLSVLVGRAKDSDAPKVVVFEPLAPERARALLAELVGLCRRARCAPLCFFPEASRRYVEVLQGSAWDSARQIRALDLAREAYSPPDHGRERGDRSDPYVAMLFGERDPISPEFKVFGAAQRDEFASFGELARLVFEPLLEAIRPPGGPE